MVIDVVNITDAVASRSIIMRVARTTPDSPTSPARLLQYCARSDPAKTTNSRFAFFRRDCLAMRSQRNLTFIAMQTPCRAPVRTRRASQHTRSTTANTPTPPKSQARDSTFSAAPTSPQPSSPARFTTTRTSAVATHVCAAHAIPAFFASPGEGNIILGTIVHHHPRAVRCRPTVRAAAQPKSARRRRCHRLYGLLPTFRCRPWRKDLCAKSVQGSVKSKNKERVTLDFNVFEPRPQPAALRAAARRV